MNADEQLARLAARQQGLFTTEDARRCGMSPTMLTTRRQRGRIERVEPAVWRFAGTPETWTQRVLASCWAERGLASHRTAGALWRLDGCRPGVVEILTERWRRRPNASVRIHETSCLHEDDRAEVDGIPVTSPARTVIDLAAVVPEDRVERAIDTIWQRQLATPEALWSCIERLDTVGRPWVSLPKRLVAGRLDIEIGTNDFEEKLFAILDGAGLPLPAPQIRIHGADGVLIGRVDWLLEDYRMVLECDSFQWHGTWRRRKADLRRDRRLVAAGYVVLRFSWEDLVDHPAQVIADILGAIRQRSA